ncbi:MAG: DUF445 family protein [Opitutales bacterium]|nr:DUF445 family protein [Opitutales bacterium]
MPKELIFILPFIAGGIGWLTNFLAVKMLFHPRKEVNALGLLRIQGVFPKRQAALAEKLGEIVSEELFSISDVTSKLREVAGSDEIAGIAARRIEKTISEKLLKTFPMLSMFLNDEMITKVSGLFLSELKGLLTEASDEIAKKLESEIDVKATVREKVENFSSDKLEDMLFSIMKKEFRFIEIVGGVLGFLIGLVQLLITWPYLVE